MAVSDRKPRVVLVGGDGRPSGVPRHLMHLADALRSEADLTVISDLDQGGYGSLAQKGVRHIIVRGLTNRMSLRHHWRGLRGLIHTLDTQHPDLIWVHARLPILLLRLMLALRLWRPACPVAFTHHGLPYGRGYQPVVHAICKWLERLLVALCPPQDLVFLNHRMAGWMARDTDAALLSRHRVHVLPNCSDLGPLDPPARPEDGTRTLAMTGRTGRQKDYDFAARLLAALPDHFRLILCGPGTDDPAFQRRLARITGPEVTARITFVGPVTDVRPVLQAADAYLLTSRYEGTPIGALEAFEAGLPIILRDFDGAMDLLAHHPCGLMIGKDGFARDARQIEALMQRFDGAREGLRAEIHAVWRRKWSPRIFARNARFTLQGMLRPAAGPLAWRGSVRDAPMRHPDRHRNAAARLPAPPPYYTAASPLAENE